MSNDDQSDQNGWSTRVGGPVDSDCAVVTPHIDTVFAVLSHEDRRDVCAFLIESRANVVSVEEIAAALGDNTEQTDTLAIDLHHRHLPRLDDAGLVDYDPRSNTVRYWGQPTLEKWLEHVRALNDDTPTF